MIMVYLMRVFHLRKRFIILLHHVPGTASADLLETMSLLNVDEMKDIFLSQLKQTVGCCYPSNNDLNE